ncbi:yip1 domain-containing protein, putative [Eimeria tenella]|uniref:Protein YIPF n=1 Tax=Eimeria tenella TaxID=5802 RepID=U6KHP2_EIMTE|nr:yip1 domain-containing protein, putative [Eimeria tenella]CDJ37444.1 yip1 domain-containing protein, putative [Eimeria tenella]|eukprot:XP_013228282.1 yip1 domain-containing protein, putative [Eimeria tenella]
MQPAHAGGDLNYFSPSASSSSSYSSSSSELKLDEPVRETIKRDLLSVWSKMTYVLRPKSVEEAGAGLRDWELWGPLLLCICLSVLLYFSASGGPAAAAAAAAAAEERQFAFALVYVFLVCGASVVTLNAQLLGSPISFFQSLCVLGYCLFPLTAAAAANLLLLLGAPRGCRLCTVLPALFWAFRVAAAFLQPLTNPKRKLLAVYPVLLFYVTISAIICAV